MKRRIVLVTGATSGIGAATAKAFAARGDQVFGAARTPVDGEAGQVLRLDVRDEASVATCLAEVERRAGGLDVLVNNAGVMLFGPVEEVPLSEARALFETNFWGVARVVNAALPLLRRSEGARIINVGSIAGTSAIPMNGFYAATKHALAGYTEALRHEASTFGVKVSLVEPSDFRSRLWSGAPITPARLPAYTSLRARVLPRVEAMIAAAPDPSPVAARIVALAAEPHPALHNPVGTWAKLLPRLKAWMPEAAFERGMKKRFGLTPER